jgi:hypothetical protein
LFFQNCIASHGVEVIVFSQFEGGGLFPKCLGWGYLLIKLLG